MYLSGLPLQVHTSSLPSVTVGVIVTMAFDVKEVP